MCLVCENVKTRHVQNLFLKNDTYIVYKKIHCEKNVMHVHVCTRDSDILCRYMYFYDALMK